MGQDVRKDRSGDRWEQQIDHGKRQIEEREDMLAGEGRAGSGRG